MSDLKKKTPFFNFLWHLLYYREKGDKRDTKQLILDSKKSIVEVGVEVDGFDLNVFWTNSKLESIELRVEHTKL